MKNLKRIASEIKSGQLADSDLQEKLWDFICYSPKLPMRLHQDLLLAQASKHQLEVYDEFFSKQNLKVNFFKWGTGKTKILLTHGWGSKAADFHELITHLITLGDFEIWSFDAPGNGSSEGRLSNLILYVEAINQFQLTVGMPDIMIGHSLGGMANIYNINKLQKYPVVLISIAPLVDLTANFKSSMTSVNVAEIEQNKFLNQFEERYQKRTADFFLNDLYTYSENLNHLLIYEVNDEIAPVKDIIEFTKEFPQVVSSAFNDTSHTKIISDSRVIKQIMSFISYHQ